MKRVSNDPSSIPAYSQTPVWEHNFHEKLSFSSILRSQTGVWERADEDIFQSTKLLQKFTHSAFVIPKRSPPGKNIQGQVLYGIQNLIQPGFPLNLSS